MKTGMAAYLWIWRYSEDNEST